MLRVILSAKTYGYDCDYGDGFFTIF